MAPRGRRTIERIIAYQVDARDRISFVNPDWTLFAAENGAPDLTPAHVVGRLLWGFVAGADVKRLYEIVFRHVRTACHELVLPMRCDGPGVRRFAQLAVAPLADSELDIEMRVLREEPRPALAVLDPQILRGSRWLTMCSWCKRVRVDVKRWVELDDPLARRTLVSGSSPHLTHGACPDCEAALLNLAEGEPVP